MTGATLDRPTRAADRAWLDAQPTERQQRVADRASQLYDGTRTVSACWRQALAEAGAA